MVSDYAGRRYVALGSSYAAGPGIRPLVDIGALRSGRNYAHLLSSRLSCRLVDVTCSSATTTDLLTTRQRTLTGTRAPQVTAVTADTALVTVTAGGNDLGFIGAMSQAALRYALRRGPAGSARPPDGQVAALVEQFGQTVAVVRSRAPDARVLLVDYLTLLGDTPADRLRLYPQDADALRSTEAALVGAFREAARAHGADLVAASAASRAHGLGTAQPWVTGLVLGVPWLGGRVPFHPTATGMEQVAGMIHTHLNGGTPATSA